MRIHLFIFFLLISPILFAQTPLIDSLERELKKAKADSVKINIYTQIGTEYLYDNIDKLLPCAKNLMALAIKNNDEKCIGIANNYYGNYYYTKSNFEKALTYFSKNVILYKKLKNNIGLGNCYLSMGNIYESMGNPDKAIHYYFKSLKIDEKIGDKQRLSDDYTNIGIFYNHRNKPEMALEYFNNALKIDLELNDVQFIVSSYLNIGTAYYALKDIPKTVDYNRKAYKLAGETNNLDARARIANNLGELMIEANNLDSALYFLLESISIKEKFEQKEGLTKSYLNIGHLYHLMNNENKRFIYLNKSYELSKSIKYMEGIMNVCLALTDHYEHVDNTAQALKFHKEYVSVRDSIFNMQSEAKITEMNTKYETEKKDASLKILNKEKKLSDLENENNKIELKNHEIQRNYFIAGLVILIAISFFIYNRFMVAKKQKLIIEKQKFVSELQRSIIEEKQKEIIDSITYAKRLQQAILAPESEIKKYFPDSFLLYKPKDIVAGDFYFFEKTDSHIFYAAADSTGHGVPGAMVSIVCSNALSRCVKEFGLTDPGKILDKARELILETFQKSGEDVKDGMDISLLAVAKQSENESGERTSASLSHSAPALSWAGANNPLWYIENNELKEIKADKQPIGKTDNPKPFTTHVLSSSFSALFLITDGYPDQFGGPKGKKFKYSNLQKALLDVYLDEPESIKQKLLDDFNQWKGDLEQVDDVCVIGIRI